MNRKSFFLLESASYTHCSSLWLINGKTCQKKVFFINPGKIYLSENLVLNFNNSLVFLPICISRFSALPLSRFSDCKSSRIVGNSIVDNRGQNVGRVTAANISKQLFF